MTSSRCSCGQLRCERGLRGDVLDGRAVLEQVEVGPVEHRGHRPVHAAAVSRALELEERAPSCGVGTRWVPPGPVSTAIAEMTQAPEARAATRTQFEASPAIRAPAMEGVKPASANPNWVPIAMPDNRTWVGKYSA